MKDLIILKLEGPLQSWGEDSPWDTRETAIMPTHSGIVGLLACAIGIPRGDARLVELSNAIRIGIRADRHGPIMQDFHTVHGDPVMTAENKKRSVGDTITTYRFYLQDAAFVVFIDADEQWHDVIVNGLKHPKWLMSFGRRACCPSTPLIPVCAQYESIDNALRNYPVCARSDDKILYEVDATHNAGSITRVDKLIGVRKFTKRHVTRGIIRKETLPCT